jgi:ferritin-like metal-binding protein YciE
MKSEVRELLTEELKDAYSAEKQALRCMQRALRKASAEELREGIQMHIEQTQVQIERVEQAMEKLSVRPGRKVCEAMRGLVEEAQHEIEEHDEKGPILDLIIVAGMQRIEHYEIAAYGTDVALAQALGEKEVADLLSQTLEEEKQTDLKLTEVTRTATMPEALAGEEEEGRRRRRPFRQPPQSGLSLPSSLEAGPESGKGSAGLIARRGFASARCYPSGECRLPAAICRLIGRRAGRAGV